MYYEHVIKELNKMVGEIDKLSGQKEELNKETRPDQVLFRKKSKVLKVKLNKITGKVMDYSNGLIQGINEKNEAKDWKKLFDMKLEQSKLELKQTGVSDRFRNLRQEYYKKMGPFMKKKRVISKESKVITEKIFERIRRR